METLINTKPKKHKSLTYFDLQVQQILIKSSGTAAAAKARERSKEKKHISHDVLLAETLVRHIDKIAKNRNYTNYKDLQKGRKPPKKPNNSNKGKPIGRKRFCSDAAVMQY